MDILRLCLVMPSSPTELTELLEQRQLVSLGETDIFSNKRKAPDSCPPIVQEPSKDDLLASFSYLAKEVQQRFPHDADVCIYAGESTDPRPIRHHEH